MHFVKASLTNSFVMQEVWGVEKTKMAPHSYNAFGLYNYQPGFPSAGALPQGAFISGDPNVQQGHQMLDEEARKMQWRRVPAWLEYEKRFNKWTQ